MMASRIHYKRDIGKTNKLMRSPEMERAMRSAARRGKEFAEAISPHETGEYAASFRVSSTRSGGVKHNRAMAVLWNDSDHAIYVEVTDGYHVLARAADFIRRAGP